MGPQVQTKRGPLVRLCHDGFDRFWADRASYGPRDYVRECLGITRSGEADVALDARGGADGAPGGHR